MYKSNVGAQMKMFSTLLISTISASQPVHIATYNQDVVAKKG